MPTAADEEDKDSHSIGVPGLMGTPDLPAPLTDSESQTLDQTEVLTLRKDLETFQ